MYKIKKIKKIKFESIYNKIDSSLTIEDFKNEFIILLLKNFSDIIINNYKIGINDIFKDLNNNSNLLNLNYRINDSRKEMTDFEDRLNSIITYEVINIIENNDDSNLNNKKQLKKYLLEIYEKFNI